MVSRRTSSRFYRWIWELGQSPLPLVEMLQFLTLGWLLILTLTGFGGFLPYGEPMPGVSLCLLLLTGLHALTMIFRSDRVEISWELLLPVPFLLYALAHYAFISPAPWASAPYLALYVQAYALYMLVFNSVHGMRSGHWILSVCQVVVAFALLMAFVRFYVFPEWFPMADNRTDAGGTVTGATGFLQDPVNLGALLVTFFPVFAILAAKHLRSGPLWMLHGFLAFALLIGIILSAHVIGLGIVLLLLLLLPLFITPHRRSHFRIWRNLILALLVLVLLIWLGTDDLRDRLSHLLKVPFDTLAAASRSVAFAEFLDSPLWGKGLGAFPLYWEQFASATVEGTSVYAASLLADLLAETGIAGLLLAGVPFGLLLVHAFRVWRREPYIRLSKEAQERMDRTPKGHPIRRRMERQQGRLPSKKAVPGALLLGLGALLGYALWDHALKLPIMVFMLAILSALLAAFSRESPRRPVASRNLRMIVAFLPMLLALWATAFGVPRFYADYLVYTAEEELEHLQAEPYRIFRDPGILVPLERDFHAATELVPGHMEAWLGKGRARLAQLNAELESRQAIAEAARPSVERALDLFPASWEAHFTMARVEALAGSRPETIEPILRRAHELAPHRPEPLAFLGNLLLLENGASGEAKALLEEALRLSPGYAPAARALRQAGLGQGPEAEGGVPEASRVINAAILAEQYRILPSQPERVLGAGVPVWKEPYAPSGEE